MYVQTTVQSICLFVCLAFCIDRSWGLEDLRKKLFGLGDCATSLRISDFDLMKDLLDKQTPLSAVENEEMMVSHTLLLLFLFLFLFSVFVSLPVFLYFLETIEIDDQYIGVATIRCAGSQR